MQEKQQFNQLQVPLAATIEVEKQTYLYFGGTAYLGIPQNKQFIKLYQEGIKKFGLNNGTGRNNNVQLSIYNEAEQYAAHRFGAAAALITSSGFLAAQFVINQFSAFGEISYAPATHPALWSKDIVNTVGKFKDWAKEIVEKINTSNIERWFLVSNSMNNLYPEIYDFSFIRNISPHKKVILVIDDSHGIGINNNGLGVLTAVPKIDHVEVIVVASMAKALGVDAGIILGAKKIINQLQQSSAFLGASPPAAAGLYAFMHGEEIYASALKKLQKLTAQLNKSLDKMSDWNSVSGFPVFLSKKPKLDSKLLKKNILISAFSYPAKNGSIINRIVLSSWHTKATINELIKALK